MISVISRV